MSHTSLQQTFSSCQLFPMQCLPPQHPHSCQVAGRISLSLEKMGESSTALPAQKLFEICSYLCQESLLCFLITANQLLHYHHLSCCFVSHLVETKPTTTGKVQEYTAAMLLQLFGKSVTFPSIQRRIGWEEIQSPGICRKPHDTSPFRIHQRCCM